MKFRARPFALVVSAGLALSATAHAQFGLVNNQPGTFTDIRTTGTVITSGDDSSVAFTSSVTNALIPTANLFASTNGNITDTSFNSYMNSALPVGVNFGLFVFWDDLFVDGPGLLVHRAVNEGGINVEIIQWSQVRLYSGGPGGTGSFQIKLFASGPIYAQFIYQDMTFAGNGISATIGAQWSAAGYDQYSVNTASIPNNAVLSVVAAVAGRCCLSNGTCSTMSQGACAGQGGLYGGDGSDCAGFTCPTGACCVNAGCVVSNLPGCVQQGGTYRGDGVLCQNAACPGPVIGPDVWTADLTDVTNFGAVGTITAYAVGTTSCNLGDAPVDWYQVTNHHPVIAQNMFRLMGGRFEQLGQSWLKHGFQSLNSGGCGTCIPPPGGGQQLGINCSDTYGSGLNGGQLGLGPRSEVNATTAAYPFPYILGHGQSGDAIYKRLQVYTADVIPAQNPGALYFVEGHYVTYDDAAWNNGLNNSSYRQVLLASETANPTFTGVLHGTAMPIQAWKDQDPTVSLVNADYVDSTITARFAVAGKATDNGNGTWHYEYAVYNHNADRSAGTFSIPVGAGIVLSNASFQAPFSHSGEPFSNAPWTSSLAAGAMTWSTVPYATNVNANAIRWGTLYNFRFDASTPPTTGAATLGLFKPGSPTSLTIPGLPIPSVTCYANCDNSTNPPILNVLDFSCFLNQFAAGSSYANCDASTTAPVLNVLDFSCFLNKFAAGCP